MDDEIRDYEDYTRLDTVVFDSYIYFYKYAAAHNKEVHIKNFNPRNYLHKYTLKIVKNISLLYGFKITLEVKWYNRIFKNRRNVILKNNLEEGIIVEDFISKVYSNDIALVKRVDDLYYAGK